MIRIGFLRMCQIVMAYSLGMSLVTLILLAISGPYYDTGGLVMVLFFVQLGILLLLAFVLFTCVIRLRMTVQHEHDIWYYGVGTSFALISTLPSFLDALNGGPSHIGGFAMPILLFF